MTDTSPERVAEVLTDLRHVRAFNPPHAGPTCSDAIALLSALAAERDALADRVDLLRDQVGRLTRERDEWEVNAIEAMDEAEWLRAALDETGDTP